MTTHNMKQSLKRQLGYTIDQTILIVAVIAILVTMIIGSVGWDLLTRAGGTKMQSHLVQFENAAGSFFSQYGQWPTDMADKPMMALIDKSEVTWTGEEPSDEEFRNYMPAYTIDGADVKHPFGQGGTVTLEEYAGGGGDGPCGISSQQSFLIFVMENVPEDEAERADEDIDGSVDGDAGRLRTDGSGSSLTVCYRANATN